MSEHAGPAAGELVGPVRIGPVAHGGHFVARHEGRVIFVRHGLTGELAMVRLTDVTHTHYWRGDAVQILEASPDRVGAPCPIASRCGGCDFQHIRRDAQRRLKAEVVHEQLSRAGLDREALVEPVPGAPADGLAWRTRMRYLVGSGRVGLRAHRSGQLVELPDGGCLIADPRGPRVAQLQEFARRAGGEDGELVVATAHSGVSVLGGGRVLGGDAVVHEEVNGRDFQVRADGFWQVHPGAATTLTNAVIEALEPTGGQTALDLYCGVGVFAAALTDAGCQVTGVELDGPALRLARRNVPGAHFVAGRVERSFRALPRRADLVVLDPPRAGAGRKVVEAICRLQPRRIGYVACDPAALARDLAWFARLGYGLARLRAFDIFPMTHHVECLALLEPDPGSGSPSS